MKLLSILLLAISFQIFAKSPVVSIMTYNVENLFDTTHDEGKEDYTYMPKAVKDRSPEIQAYCNSIDHDYYRKSCLEMDWTQELLDKKIQGLSKVIKNYNKGNGPDILVLQEVENLNVVKMLNEKGTLGYQTVVLLEGPDSRGIDTAILSRFPLAYEPRLNIVDFTDLRNQGIDAKDTRGILEATFWIENKKLTVFANHWPSQSNDDLTRVVAAQTLMKRAASLLDTAVVALGDFNTIDSNSPHAINDYILDNSKEGSFMAANQSKIARLFKGHPGSHWYKGEYSHLDRIFFLNRTLMKTGFSKCQSSTCVKPVWSSFTINAPKFVLRDREWRDYDTNEVHVSRKIPFRFDTKTALGYSDHLGVAIKVRLK